MRLAFLHLVLCASCFLAFAQQGKEETSGLQEGDAVRIRPGQVHRDLGQQLRLDLRVDEQGRITLPGFGLALDVEGLQATGAASLIQSELRAATGVPDLEVTVLSSRDGVPLPEQNCLAVGGQVREPGQVPYRPGMSLAEAIEAAGGATEFGATNRIQVYRKGNLKTHDLDNPRDANSRLMRYDILEVPEKNWVGR